MRTTRKFLMPPLTPQHIIPLQFPSATWQNKKEIGETWPEGFAAFAMTGNIQKKRGQIYITASLFPLKNKSVPFSQDSRYIECKAALAGILPVRRFFAIMVLKIK